MRFDAVKKTDSWLTRSFFWCITPAVLLVFCTMLLSAGLHLVNLENIGEANLYYTAAVKSMLQSWHNFFFAAAEPGGSVTVDKPPLGLWIEAAFALMLGVNGFSVSLPNILAGIFNIPLLYHLVKKHFGAAAGLAAGLVMAVTPVVIAVDRNNTMDGMLTFTLLLAAWAFIRATESGKTRFLLLGAFIVGMGFNIKMLQAYLPLPAFFALYLLGAGVGWRRKILNLAGASMLLLVVSLSWAVIVDLTPASQRPYIGSSTNNTVMELILGYNGAARLLGRNWENQGQGAIPIPNDAGQDQPPLYNQNGPRPAPGGNAPGGIPPSQAPRPAPAAGADDARPRGGATSSEVGIPGLMRFFKVPLAKEMSWMLPFALIAMVLIPLNHRIRLPLSSDMHKGLLLWGGWLMTCLVFFSIASFFHAYYMGMLAPALGAVVGGGLQAIWNQSEQRRWKGWLLPLAALVTIAFQVYLAAQLGVSEWWVWLPAVFLTVGSLLLAISHKRPAIKSWLSGGFTLSLTAMLLIPLVWSYRTARDLNRDTNLVSAYAGDSGSGNPTPQGGGRNREQMDADLLAFLQENTSDVLYLLAVPSAQTGARYVLTTGRPVLYMGGFSGSDPVVAADDLAAMVMAGELRYVLFNESQKADQGIGGWLLTSCSMVNQFRSVEISGRGSPGSNLSLYECSE